MNAGTQRALLAPSTLVGVVLVLVAGTTFTGCRASSPWLDGEQQLVTSDRDDFDIVLRNTPQSSVLRLRAREVPKGLPLELIAHRMVNTMNRAEGVGLAGPQVGLSLRVATILLNCRSETPRTVFAVNPVIVARSDATALGPESCLSIPDVRAEVRRHTWIRVEYTDLDGERVQEEAHGLDAVIWQHEIDHLDGVLFIDRIPTIPEKIRASSTP